MMKFESVSVKLNIAIVGISIASLITASFVLFWYADITKTDVYENTQRELQYSIDDKINSKMRVGITNAISIANDERIKKAFRTGDRDYAIKSLQDISKKMREYTDFKNIKIHLHTKDNRSFLRNWNRDKFGDDLSSFRAGVVDVNLKKIPITSFEIGRAGLLLRAITPIIDENSEHFGSLEFIQGINSVAKSFAKENIGFLLLMDTKSRKSVIADDKKFKNYAISQKFVDKVFLDDAKSLDIGLLLEKGYLLSSKYFYTYTDIRDFQNKKLGIALLAKPLSVVNRAIDSSETLIYLALFGIVIMTLIINIIIMIAVKKLIKNPLSIFEDALLDFFQFLQGKKDYTKTIDIDSDDEFGVMARSLKENIAVSARLHEEIRELNVNLEKKVELRTQELAQKNKEVEDSIEYASTIQKSFLKNHSVIQEQFSDSFIIWQPRDKVGGDLYIYEESDIGTLVGAVDCTGHSVPGGFMTMLAGSVIKKLSSEFFDNPAKLLSELNVAIKNQLNQDGDSSLSDDGLDIGLCFINKEKTLLRYSGAKLDLVYFRDNEMHIIKSNKQSIGYRKSKEDYEYTNHEIHINRSKTFYLYSDGITDQVGGVKNFPFSDKKFKVQLSKIQDRSMNEQKEIILDNLMTYQGENSRRDDITVIGFKI